MAKVPHDCSITDEVLKGGQRRTCSPEPRHQGDAFMPFQKNRSSAAKMPTVRTAASGTVTTQAAMIFANKRN